MSRVVSFRFWRINIYIENFSNFSYRFRGKLYRDIVIELSPIPSSKHLRQKATFRRPGQYFQYSHRGNYPRQQRGSGFGQSRKQEVLAPPAQSSLTV